jgi:23S rRNA (cytidine2498-2'-O)-methyltransferase
VRRYHAETTVLQHIDSGYSLLQNPYPFDRFTSPWRHRLPIYLHHLFPVHTILPLEATTNDLAQLKQAAMRIGSADTTIQVRSIVEGLPYSPAEIQQFLDVNHDNYSADTPQGRILSILIAREQTGLRAYLGVSWATQNLSPWVGGQIPVTESVPNRAGYKLLEAIQAFDIRLRQGDHALDLGAAPGAWTTLLRRRGLRVTAVAPTPLYPWLTFDAEVTYQPMVAEEFLGRCKTIFDLIINDMNLDARDSARLMVDYAPYLRREGIAIMTLKLHEKNQQRVMDHTFRILRKTYKIIRVRQLVSNRKEVSLFLRRKT